MLCCGGCKILYFKLRPKTPHPELQMGNHLLDLSAPEITALLKGEPGAPFWNSTYIWGVYNGEVRHFCCMPAGHMRRRPMAVQSLSGGTALVC